MSIPIKVEMKNGSPHFFLDEEELTKLGFVKKEEIEKFFKMPEPKKELKNDAISQNEAMKLMKIGFSKLKSFIDNGLLKTTPDGKVLKSSIEDYYSGDFDKYKKRK